jgi:hypothetical protein
MKKPRFEKREFFIGSVDIVSASATGCIINLIMGLVVGIGFGLLRPTIMSVMSQTGMQDLAVRVDPGLNAGFIMAVGAWAVIGLIFWGICAALYNIAAFLTGGVILDLREYREPLPESEPIEAESPAQIAPVSEPTPEYRPGNPKPGWARKADGIYRGEEQRKLKN